MNLKETFIKPGKKKKTDDAIKLNNCELKNDKSYRESITSERLLQSYNILKNYVIISMGLGMVPVPIFDLVALIGIQIKMVHSLAKQYGIPFKQDVAKSLVMSLISTALGVAGVMGMASLSKVFPMLGALFGGATIASLSSSLTYAVGRVFIWHFEQGGTLLDFDPKKMHKFFKRELKVGKEVSKDLEASLSNSYSE